MSIRRSSRLTASGAETPTGRKRRYARFAASVALYTTQLSAEAGRVVEQADTSVPWSTVPEAERARLRARCLRGCNRPYDGTTKEVTRVLAAAWTAQHEHVAHRALRAAEPTGARARRRLSDAEATRRHRASDTEAQRIRRQLDHTEAVRRHRASETEAQRIRRQLDDTEAVRRHRASDTEAQRIRRQLDHTEAVRRHRASETEAQRIRRQLDDTEAVRRHRASETEAQRIRRQLDHTEAVRRHRASETEAQRIRRQLDDTEAARRRRAAETEVQVIRRQLDNTEAVRRHRVVAGAGARGAEAAAARRQQQDRNTASQAARRAAGVDVARAVVHPDYVDCSWHELGPARRRAVEDAAVRLWRERHGDASAAGAKGACAGVWDNVFNSAARAGRAKRGSRAHMVTAASAVSWVASDERVCGHCGCVHLPPVPGRAAGYDPWPEGTTPLHSTTSVQDPTGDGLRAVERPVVSGGALCCAHGLRKRHPHRPAPQAYVDLLLAAHNEVHGRSIRSVVTHTRSRYYNNLVNLAGTGFTPGPAHGGKSFMKPADFNFPRFLPAAVTVHGTPYHRVGPLAADAAGSPLNGGLSWYITPEGRLSRAAKFKLSAVVVRQLASLLTNYNRVVQLVEPAARSIGPDVHMVMRYDPSSAPLGEPGSQDRRDPEIAVTFDASLLRGGADRTRAVVFHERGTGDCCFVDTMSAWVEPLCYPLLFFYGELGWGKDRDGTVHSHPVPVDGGTTKPLTCLEYTRQALLTEPLFRILARLSSEWLVNQHLRIQEARLSYIRYQVNARRVAPRCVHEQNTEGAGRVILPESFLDSSRKKKKLTEDALHINRRLGAPTFFVTITMDGKWWEIRRALLRGQTAYDRPALVCRVFKRKADAILAWLEAGGLLATVVDPADSRMVYRIHVVEFQKRGFPHIHLAMRCTPEPPLHLLHRVITAHYPIHSSYWAGVDDELLNDGVAKVLERAFTDTVKRVAPRPAAGAVYDDRPVFDPSFSLGGKYPGLFGVPAAARTRRLACDLKEASDRRDMREMRPALDRWWVLRQRRYALETVFIANIERYNTAEANWVGPHFKFHLLYPPGSALAADLVARLEQRLGPSVRSPYEPEEWSLHPQHTAPPGFDAFPAEYRRIWHWWTVHLHQILIDKFGLRHTKCIPGRCFPTGCAARQCKGGYPFPINHETFVDARGYVNHRRPNRHSAYVVPHNFELLLVGGCHINTEFSHKVNVLFYLYKYLFKPEDRAFIKLTDEFLEARCRNDEINDFKFHRYVSACEAAWRVLKFSIHPQRYPAVVVLPVHLPGMDVQVVAHPLVPAHRPVPVGVRVEAERYAAVAGVTLSEAIDAVDDGTTLPVVDAVVPDDSFRDCTKLEQWLLRPSHVRVPEGAAAAMHLLHRNDHYDVGDEVSDDGHVLVCTRRMLYARYHEFFVVGSSAQEDATVDLTTARNTVVHRTRPTLHRMRTCRTQQGDQYYLRLLLCYTPSPSLHGVPAFDTGLQHERMQLAWAGYRTVEGREYATFREACTACGIAGGDREYLLCFEEAIAEGCVGRMLRQLFVTTIVNTEADAELLWATYGEPSGDDPAVPPLWIDLYERDIPRGSTRRPPFAAARHECLLDLKQRIESASAGKTLSDYLNVDVEDTLTELGRERMIHDPFIYMRHLGQHLGALVDTALADNREQRAVFQQLTGFRGDISGLQMLCAQGQLAGLPPPAFPSDTTPLYVDGMSGRGKTLVMTLVTAYYRMYVRVVVCVASTGVAALNHAVDGLVYGSTAHSMCGIPVIPASEALLTAAVVSTVQPNSQRAALLRAASLVLWDELPMANRLQLDCVDTLFQELHGDERPFGAALFAGFGDSHQIPPVVEKATRADLLQMTIRNSRNWGSFAHMELHAPKRDAADPAYSAFVDSVGSGTLAEILLPSEPDVPLVQLPNLAFETSLEAGVRSVFGTAADMVDHDRAVLCTHNYAVDQVNAYMLARLPGERRTFYSTDSVKEGDDGGDGDMYHREDFLQSITGKPGQLPPHALELKEGAMVMCMRNLSKKDRLMNGTRCVILRVLKYSVIVQTRDGLRHILSKIHFEHHVCDGITMVRKQVPLRLAYAMTVHKVQGRTLTRVCLDLRGDPFAHGQLYVALGRARCASSVVLVVNPQRVYQGILGAHATLCATTRNIVYRELLPQNFTDGLHTPPPPPRAAPVVDASERDAVYAIGEDSGDEWSPGADDHADLHGLSGLTDEEYAHVQQPPPAELLPGGGAASDVEVE